MTTGDAISIEAPPTEFPSDSDEMLCEEEGLIFEAQYSHVWQNKSLENALSKALKALKAHNLTKPLKGLVALNFTDNATIQPLNKIWRGFDKPTNVLSFPSEERDSQTLGLTHPSVGTGHPLVGLTHPYHFGDIIFALEVIEQEASELKIPFEHHLIHLILHGVLHLLGYDHEREEEAQTMESLEIELLSLLNIKSPYDDELNHTKP